jgi:predicted  nucleic acid-binding Zn ribbon protein
MIKKTYFIYANNKPITDSYILLPIQDIEKIPNGSADEIICNCIDSIQFNDRDKLISILINKVKINGLVIIQNIDLYILCKYIMNNTISIDQANTIISSSASLVDDYTMEDMIQKISNAKILDSLYDNIQRIITLQRISK